MQVLGKLIRESDDADAFEFTVVAAQLIADAIEAQSAQLSAQLEAQSEQMNARMLEVIEAIEAMGGVIGGVAPGSMKFNNKKQSGLIGAFA